MLKTLVVLVLLFLLAFAGFAVGVNMAYPVAQKKGYQQALTDLQALLASEDIMLSWTEIGDGQYRIEVSASGSGELLFTFTNEFHLLSQQFRPWSNLSPDEQDTALTHLNEPWMWLTWADLDGDGVLEDYAGILDDHTNSQFLYSTFYHAMSTTTGGKNWVEQQLFDTNASQKGLYLANSNASDTFSAAWNEIPSEITTDGLARALGSYASTGDGAANVTKTFSVTGTKATKLYGLYYDSYTSTKLSLICAEQTGVGNQKNLNSGDSLKLTVQWSLS